MKTIANINSHITNKKEVFIVDLQKRGGYPST